MTIYDRAIVLEPVEYGDFIKAGTEAVVCKKSPKTSPKYFTWDEWKYTHKDENMPNVFGTEKYWNNLGYTLKENAECIKIECTKPFKNKVKIASNARPKKKHMYLFHVSQCESRHHNNNHTMESF